MLAAGLSSYAEVASTSTGMSALALDVVKQIIKTTAATMTPLRRRTKTHFRLFAGEVTPDATAAQTRPLEPSFCPSLPQNRAWVKVGNERRRGNLVGASERVPVLALRAAGPNLTNGPGLRFATSEIPLSSRRAVLTRDEGNGSDGKNVVHSDWSGCVQRPHTAVSCGC